MYHEDDQPANILTVPVGDDEYYTDDTFDDFDIDQDWNMLIPTLKEIEDILYASFTDVENTVQNFFNMWMETETKTLVFTDNQLKFGLDINEVFVDVVEFIKLYNIYKNF